MRNQNNSKSIYFFCSIGLFALISKYVFDNINDSTDLIIDELFHIPQGVQYCKMNFTTWDPKITTLPGLYILSAILLGPFGLCTVYWLRFTNLLISIINLYLFHYLFHLEESTSNIKRSVSWSTIISSINLGMLPPLYFFSHIYYTDILSVNAVLLTVILAKKDRYIFASLVGFLSFIVRQTNIVWVGMILAEQVLQIFVQITSKKGYKSKKSHITFWDLYNCVADVWESGLNIRKISKKNWLTLSCYLSVIVAFGVFVMLNNGIVVGDKSAHVATLHMPQLFYFSLFCAVFAHPHFCLEIIPFIKFAIQRKLLIVCMVIICLVIVHTNTLCHPYLLADNRHYTFYIWNRIYGRYTIAKYVAVCVYLFSMYATLKRIDAIKNFGFLLAFLPCMTLVLVMQKMIDVRYFFIPFVLLRTKFKECNFRILIAETLFYLAINFQTFYLFFTKEIYWKDFDYVQRLIW